MGRDLARRISAAHPPTGLSVPTHWTLLPDQRLGDDNYGFYAFGTSLAGGTDWTLNNIENNGCRAGKRSASRRLAVTCHGGMRYRFPALRAKGCGLIVAFKRMLANAGEPFPFRQHAWYSPDGRFRVRAPQSPLENIVHKFSDFKGFRDAELDLFQPVTLLVGKNASGKTNAIEAVELLAHLAHGRPLYEVTDVGRGGPDTFELRGGLPACPRVGGSRFKLGFDGATLRFQGRRGGVSYWIEIEVDPQPRIVAESLRIGERILFDAVTKSPAEPDILTAQYDNFARGGNKPRMDLPADRSVVSRYAGFTSDLRSRNSPVWERHQEACRVIDAVNRYLHAAFVFDPVPSAMRAYERVGQKTLLRNGSNLSSVLYALGQGDDEDQATLRRILDRIRQIPEEPFLDFDFIVTRQQDVLLAFKDTEDGPSLDARVMSDGTLRSLAVLAALETVEPHSRIIIEEFDNGLHPSRVGVLAGALWDCAKRRKLNVLATTHNPATLNALDSEQLQGVVLCFRDGEQSASRLTPLLDVPRADVLLEQGQLGDLVTRNVVERYLAPRFAESQRHKALQWLESLDR